MRVVRYSIRSNRCLGWHQPIAVLSNGTNHEGARWPTWVEARDAIHFHHKNGIFPSEVEDTEIAMCEACGQPLPEESK